MAPSIEELRSLMEDLILRQRETDRLFKETAQQFRETDRKFQESVAETSRRYAATDRKFQETDRRIQKAVDLFEQQWGKLMESLAEGDLVRILQQRGVDIRRTSQRVKGNAGGDPFEYDTVAHNGDEIVVVEVKTSLRVKHVRNFAGKMARFRQRMPEYANLRVYGALAYLQALEEAETYAQREGFFVIRATGSSASLVNAEDFQPKAF